MSVQYILSQIFILINYLFLIMTYQSKNRNHILVFNFIGIIATGISFLLLSAYSGIAMVFVALIRNVLFIINEKKNEKRDKHDLKDYIVLALLFTVSIISGILTYNGILSMSAVIATIIYTYSIWQKNTKIYKILGLPTGILSIIYYIYIFSIFGIVLESILTLSSIIGYIKEIMYARNSTENSINK